MMPDQQDMSGNSYYPQENDLTGGLPINLDSLRDGPPGSKPFYPYSTLIRQVFDNGQSSGLLSQPSDSSLSHLSSYAIKGSPNQKLLLEDIYYAIESRVRYAFCGCELATNLSCFPIVPLLQDRP